MTTRGWHRRRLLWDIRHWMRRHGAWFVFALVFLVASPNVALAAEAKLDSYAELVRSLEKEKTVKSTPVPTPAKAVKAADKKEEKEKDEKVVEKKVKGTVSFIRKNKIAIEFGADEEGGEEILLGIEKDVKLKKVKTFEDIAPGDTVSVKYLETYREPKTPDGEKFVLSMAVSEIVLINKAKPAQGAAMESMGKLLE